MKQLMGRLSHWIKFHIGNLLRHFLRSLLIHRWGSAARFREVFAPGATPLPQCQSQVFLPPIPLPSCTPEYMLSGQQDELYWEKLRSCGYKDTSPGGIISVHHVQVALPIGLHLWRGKVFSEVLPGESVLMNPKYILGLEKIPFSPAQKQGEGILLTGPWHHNFFHWMAELLPRLSIYDRATHLHHLPLIVPQSSPSFVRTSLELMGYLDRVHFLKDGTYSFETLHLLTQLAPTANVSPDAVSWLNENVPRSTELPHKRLYISRADANLRYVTNERELDSLLAEYDFETIVMRNYTLREQIQLFQRAAIVMGPHGAAFSHIAFMVEGTKFIEFFQAGHFNRCFHRIASARHLKYGFLVSPVDGLGLRVDVDQLQELLQRALSNPAIA